MAQKFKLVEEAGGALYIAPCIAWDDDQAVGNFAETKRRAIAENRARMRPYMAAIRQARALTSKKAGRADYTRPLPFEDSRSV